MRNIAEQPGAVRSRSCDGYRPAATLRIGFVLHVMQVAGAEMLVAETIRRLAGRITPTIFCLDAIGTLGEQLQAEGVEVVCLGRRPGRDWRMVWRLAHELRTRRIEVMHAHQYTPFFYAALAKSWFRRRPRLIFTEHGRHYPDIVSRLRSITNHVLLHRFADAINACCAFSAQSLHTVDGFPMRRVDVIENGIDVSRYGAVSDRAALRRRLGLDTEPPLHRDGGAIAPGQRSYNVAARLRPGCDRPGGRGPVAGRRRQTARAAGGARRSPGTDQPGALPRRSCRCAGLAASGRSVRADVR